MAATSNNMNEFQNCHVELLKKSNTQKNTLCITLYSNLKTKLIYGVVSQENSYL